MIKKTSFYILKVLKEKLTSSTLKEEYKLAPNAFKRTRKLTFELTLIIMMNFLKKSLTIEIHDFFKNISNISLKSIPKVTSSAFVQARNKISPEVFVELSNTLINEYYTDNDENIQLWKNFRMLAVDGTTINLPHTKKNAEKFGFAKNHLGETSVQARSSVLYDVLNHMVIDAVFEPRRVYEREMANKHLKHTSDNDLIIFDRGYYSYIFINQLGDTNYVFRLQSSLNIVKSFVKSKKNSAIVTVNRPQTIKKIEREKYPKTIKLRLVRVELPHGEIEVLATSLTNSKQFPSNQFKELYFKRWKVEIFYDELKNKLNVELFSGYSENSIMQEFYCAIFISNVQSLIVQDIKQDLKLKSQSKKYEQKVNTNLSYGFMKNKILEVFFSEGDMQKALEELKQLFLENTIPIRPNRKVSRENKNRRKQAKRKVTKNHRDAF